MHTKHRWRCDSNCHFVNPFFLLENHSKLHCWCGFLPRACSLAGRGSEPKTFILRPLCHMNEQHQHTKGLISALKTQQQRPESPTVTRIWTVWRVQGCPTHDQLQPISTAETTIIVCEEAEEWPSYCSHKLTERETGEFRPKPEM